MAIFAHIVCGALIALFTVFIVLMGWGAMVAAFASSGISLKVMWITAIVSGGCGIISFAVTRK